MVTGKPRRQRHSHQHVCRPVGRPVGWYERLWIAAIRSGKDRSAGLREQQLLCQRHTRSLPCFRYRDRKILFGEIRSVCQSQRYLEGYGLDSGRKQAKRRSSIGAFHQWPAGRKKFSGRGRRGEKGNPEHPFFIGYKGRCFVGDRPTLPAAEIRYLER